MALILAKGSGMVIGCGYQTTHILPVIRGQLDLHQCRRINIGGAHVDGFMQRLLQLKYPGHLNAITLPRAEVSSITCSSRYFRLWLTDYIIEHNEQNKGIPNVKYIHATHSLVF